MGHPKTLGDLGFTREVFFKRPASVGVKMRHLAERGASADGAQLCCDKNVLIRKKLIFCPINCCFKQRSRLKQAIEFSSIPFCG